MIIDIVIGANYGDEGKGLVVNYLAEQSTANKIINIRYHGGAQAGHTVILKDGTNHVFSHMGSATFQGVDTYLDKEFICNPILFRKEMNTFISKFQRRPKIYVNGFCKVTTPQDMMLNHLRVLSQGNNPEGSCGIGILETIERKYRQTKQTSGVNHNWQYANLLWELQHKPFTIHHNELQFCVQQYLRQARNIINKYNLQVDSFYLDVKEQYRILTRFIEDLRIFIDLTSVSFEHYDDTYDHFIYEGSQGLRLSADNIDEAPYLTPSIVGSKSLVNNLIPLVFTKFCSRKPNESIIINRHYVTRSYMTRHGAGLFVEYVEPGLDPDQPDISNIVEETNTENYYQGRFKIGPIPLLAFAQYIKKDIVYLDKERFTNAYLPGFDVQITNNLHVNFMDQLGCMDLSCALPKTQEEVRAIMANYLPEIDHIFFHNTRRKGVNNFEHS